MARAPSLPNWRPTPKPPSSSGDRENVNGSARDAKERQVNVAALGEPYPWIYGRDRVGGLIAGGGIHNGNLILRIIWGVGPIEAVESITIDDKPLEAGVTVTHYLGVANQKIDPQMLLAIPNYADTLTGAINGRAIALAYSVFSIPANAKNNGWPKINAIIKGRHVFDPRDAAHDYDDVSTWRWTQNPALCLADLIRHAMRCPVYGVVEAANYCDEQVDSAMRRTLNLALINRQSPYQWIETLSVYAGCFVVPWQEGMRLIPDAPTTTTGIVGAGDIKKVLRLATKPMRDQPTMITLWYTDTSKEPWKDTFVRSLHPEVEQGSMGWRDSDIRLPGIHHAAEAARMANERLKKLRLDLELETLHHDDGLLLEQGCVYAIIEPKLGLTNKLMRLTGKTPDGEGNWRCSWLEYQPSVYDDSAITPDNWLPDTDLPNPLDIPAVTNLVLTEDIYRLQTGRWGSRIQISWQQPTLYPFPVSFEIQVLQGAQTVWSALIGGQATTTAPLPEFLAYTVKVRMISTSTGYGGVWTQADITTDGKQFPPSNVPSFNAYEVSGRVFARWDMAQDRDIEAYLWGYVMVGGGWDHHSFTLIDRVDALADETVAIPAGQWDLLIRALDSVGNLSPQATRTPILVSSDEHAYRAGTHDFVHPITSCMSIISLPQEQVAIYRSTSLTAWNTLFPDALNSYIKPLYRYGLGASEWLSENHDFGTVISGSWAAYIRHRVLKGDVVQQMELSVDAATWTNYPALATKTMARHGRVRISAMAGDAFEVALPRVSIVVDGSTRTRKGRGTTDSSGQATVLVGEGFVELRRVLVVPLATADWYVDNVSMGVHPQFNVLLLHPVSRDPIACDFLWEFEGI